MIESQHKKETLKHGLNSTAKILIVAGILIAINVIGTQVFKRIDLTEGKEFTVSKSTREILKKLEDVVLVKVFFSENLPPQLASLEQNVEDILKEYQVYSDGNIRVRYIDPGDDPDLKGEAQSMQIPQLQMNILEKDEYKITNVYLGMGIQYGDKIESIPVIQDLSTFEYDLTSAIVKLTREDTETKIGFLSGHGERARNGDYAVIDQLLSERFAVQDVNLNGGATAVPDDIEALVIAGPKDISDRETYEIDQYVMRGGKLLCLVDPIELNEQAGLQARAVDSGLGDLLSSYGVSVRSAIIRESRQASAMASFSQGYMSYIIPYPFWAKLHSGLLSTSHPITSRLESLTLPWTAPLDLLVPELGDEGGEDADTSDVRSVVLARSTEQAGTQSGRYDLNPQSPSLQTPAVDAGSIPLAVALTGSFRSFYDGQPVPAKPVSDTDSDPVMPAGAEPLLQSPETQIVVVGTSHFLSGQFLRMFPENQLFVENAMDWMTLGNDLIAIRSRGATDRPLKALSEGGRSWVKYLNTFGVAALVVILGLLGRFWRKRSRQKLAESYGS